MRLLPLAILMLALGGVASSTPLTPTEHTAIRTLPAPGAMTIDGDAADWDLSGGLFCCDDVENQRERFAVWMHLQFDAD